MILGELMELSVGMMSSYYFKIGKSIMKYQNTMNESITTKNSFERTAYGDYRCLCINYYPFSSEVMISKWDTSKYDFVMGFCYTGNKWSISLRSVGDFDVSEIAKARGGGGHKNAAGFEVDSFDKIWE
jgi:nanoRNase/pAp phosphatase (c-di-AMP/oligoRNAs hydrolase)